ncbi:rhodopsin-like receptor precursor [Zea mays]|uniref:Rhodopsin-like receptor n=1 Tax=Zea mays TaxID=4577 RepID=B6TUA3_MAIZE|nr:rhodopsin-like receptor precursor [Zea mays]ACG40686.1 rhodopsin-like receptor [Zea mays]|eukprot:NP_001150861.1 rhodopsin-like receptor precursor [Zea mays]
MPPSHRNFHFFITSVLVLLVTSAAALSVSTPVKLTFTSHPPASVPLPSARPLSGGDAAGPYCTRVLLRGRPSRLRDPSRFFHALRLRANATRPHGLELCFHRNATVGPCQCAASQWQKMPKSGLWMQAISPYDHRILDFRMPTDPSRSVVVSTEEEFLLHRVVFLVLGLVLMVVAQTLSESVVFYYGGAMTIGIFLVILIILFQGMKLLPTGRKSSLAIFTYSSLVGMTTYFLHYLSGMLRSVLVEIGIAEDMHNPLGIFVLVSVILAGAWFGYWGVRKFVLAEDGSVDEGVAYFVEWAILIVSAVMILQSSLDYLFAFTTLVLCGIIKVIARIEGKSKVLRYIFGGLSDGTSRNSSRYGDFDEDYSSMNEDRQDGFGNLHGGYQRHAPRRNSPLAGSAKTLSQGVAMDSFYSTFHTTPERMEFTKEEYEAFTRKETKKAMKQLLSSPDFNRWALANADRISVAPPGGSYSSNNSQQRHRFLGLF